MNSNVRYPIALKRETNSLVHPFEVENGLNCKCFCPECDEDLIAINNDGNKQTEHFRHQKHTNCKGNFETYIHWLSKEIFKQIGTIELPEIKLNDLYDNYLSEFKDFESRLIDLYNKYQVPKELRHTFKYDIILQEKQLLKFEKISNEETFKTTKGDFRVDTVLVSQKNKMFVEPYFSNPISRDKYEKLMESDISTLAINLAPFVLMNNYIFSIEDFKKYIISDILSKSWVIIRSKKIKTLLQKFFIELEKRLIENISDFSEHKSIQKKIGLIKKDKEVLYTEMQKLRDKLQLLSDKTKKNNINLKKLETEYYKKFK